MKFSPDLDEQDDGLDQHFDIEPDIMTVAKGWVLVCRFPAYSVEWIS